LLPKALLFLKNEGFLTKLDTNGSNPLILQALIKAGLIDYVAMDVKSCLDEASYCKVTRAQNMLQAVKKSIQILLEGSIKYEFRVTVLPSFHCPEDIYKLAKELNGAARLRIQNFNPSETILDPALKTLRPYSELEIDLMQKKVNQLIACN
jgi:pyruvate formate lyase activating enzyme